MLDFRLNNCPASIRNAYQKVIRICDSEYITGTVVGVLMTRGGANGILVYKDPKFNWYDGVSFYDSERNGNFVAELDGLDSEMERQICLRKEYGEGNYTWYKFGD